MLAISVKLPRTIPLYATASKKIEEFLFFIEVGQWKRPTSRIPAEAMAGSPKTAMPKSR
jgi:hypothetical protein